MGSDEATTLVERFQALSSERGAHPAMRYREDDGSWGTITYDEMAEQVERVSLGLQALGVEPGDRVAILSNNRPEWAIADFAILHAGATVVSIYPTLTPDQVAFLLEDSGSKVLFVEDPEHHDLVAPHRGKLEQLKEVVLFDGAEQVEGVHSLDEIAEMATGREDGDEAFETRWRAVEPDDLVTFIYTSGTTGKPKGVMLTHRNITGNAAAGVELIPLGEEEHYLSFLPLSHSYERSVGHFLNYCYTGATVWYAESIDTLARDLSEARPTLMLAVPRLYEKMRARIEEKVEEANPVRQRLFHWATDVGARMFRHREAGTEPPLALALQYEVADRLVLERIRTTIGFDRLRFCGSGAAALEEEVAEFFGALGILVLEGYGLTEASPVISMNRPEAFRVGTVGQPIPGVEVKIDEEAWDGPEGEGELLARGENIMQGYWQRPEETKQALDDGWLRTGDVASMGEDGFITITDRKKELFKTAYGKYVAPAHVEGLLKNSRFVDMAVAVGAERKYVAALLVPEFENLEGWAKKHDISFRTHGDLVEKDEVRELFQQAVDEANETLARHEQVKTFALIAEPFEIGRELTPTLKVKRRVIDDAYGDVIDGLYPDG